MATTTPTRFRSRHASYRFRSLQFANCVAKTTDSAIIEAAKRDPSFGQGRDFWIDAAPEVRPESAGGKAKPAATPPALPSTEDLAKLKKGELIDLATERGVEAKVSDTKEEIIERLTAPAA